MMSELLTPALNSSKVITRYQHNPILAAKDIPYPAEMVFNAGVTKFNGKYITIFRNDYNFVEGRLPDTNLGIAFSDDGLHWSVRETPFFTIDQLEQEEIIRIYDPRLTVIEGRCYICFAADTHHGLRGGIAVTDNFENFRIISMSVPDNRNMVLFPEKINGMYVRLERPFPVYSRGGVDRFDTWLSKSLDLIYWGESALVLAVEDVPFANDKIGPAAPPVKTEKGWLTTFHAVDIDPSRGKNGWEASWKKRYTAGIMLLDLNNPEKVIGISKEPLIAPEVDYEIKDGFRNHVIFPGGMILEEDGEVKIYYGAADIVECLATAHVDDLIRLCKPLN